MKETSELVLAIDQGTTGSTVVLLDTAGRAVARGSREFPQHFPKPGWVEHEPDEIWASVLGALDDALGQVADATKRIIAVGITNQRETVVVWDAATSRPLHRALVWQDRRTSERCRQLQPHAARVQEVTGLVIDPYFSASKLAWLLDNDSSLKRAAGEGRARFGTVDSYLVERLSGARSTVSDRHVIEVTNASRTLLMDLKTCQWSDEMCDLWGVPRGLLPDIVSSAGIVAKTKGVPGLPDGIPISGIAGDQHAALFGQGCIQPGDSKCTYGTGAFVLVNTGSTPLKSEAGLLSTLAWKINDEVVYALEGASFIAGAAVQWLRDGLGLIETASDVEALAREVESTDGVAFVPALAGLGAPYWDPEARGLICGITRGTTRAHLARATLEAIAFQVDDLLRAMGADLTRETGEGLTRVRVDGGASKNNLLLQMQSDFSGLAVDRPQEVETTARGAGLLAAIGVGALAGPEQAAQAFHLDQTFSPLLENVPREKERTRWEQAVARSRSS
jgi:glycerol kinase